jgi:hypothetical protein
LLRSAFPRWARLVSVFCAAGLLWPTAARADNCKRLRYTFQPDCFRAADGSTCLQKVDKLDLGPQIAVWIETADHQFVDTLMVTNMVAARGLGNRPGEWNFLSGPKFPYGKRTMALPIWAHARNVLYPQVVMQDGMEDWLGWHESLSSEDPYYCRPVREQEINVDAITCPTKFNSAKGKVDTSLPMVYYPPRNDLTNFTNKDCDQVGGATGCKRSAERYATMNDLDAVAAATPLYGRPYTGTWFIPADRPAGDYALMVEVNKEYDGNDSHMHPSFEDPRLVGYGTINNFGQPAVVWRVPVRLDAPAPRTFSTSMIYGYGAWDGANGAITPRDQTISSGVPGSGEGRLLEIAAPSGGGAVGRVHVSVEECDIVVGDPDAGVGGAGGGSGDDGGGGGCDDRSDLPPVKGLTVDPTSIGSTTARIQFSSAANVSQPSSYEVRYRVGQSLTDDDFLHQAVRAPQVVVDSAGMASVVLPDLKPATSYAVGVKYDGPCARRSQLAWTTFATPKAKFTQLSGCFIATAAYGSAMAPDVDALRRVRDDLTRRSALFAVAADLYYRSGPAAADALQKSDTARAVVRRLLGPAAALARVASGR